MSTLKTNTISNTAGTHSFEVANIGGLGLTGETWVDETANRQAGTDYTNDTGKPIIVSSFSTQDAAGIEIQVSVDGIKIQESRVRGGSGACTLYAYFIVPNNSVYRIDFVIGTLSKWFELK